jgi:microcystin-dependent protein
VLSASPTFTGVPAAPTAAFGTNTTQLATTAFVQQAGLVGEIKMWGLPSAPTGYLMGDGSAVSRTTYADLFAVYGTTFGAGDGSTTFNLPNFTNRMPIGAGGLYSANSQGGSKDAIVVSHTHTATVTDPGHVHGSLVGGAGGSTTGAYWGATNVISYNTISATTGISVSNSTTGSSGTGANLPPYLGIYFIVKY